MIQLTDSLTGTKAPLTTRDNGAVGVYWCGPTVYDVPHLGHARSALGQDILVRYLRWRGYDVTLVSNITDIEDKIIARSAERGITAAELSREFEDIYVAEMDRLNVTHPDHRPRATEYVAEMIEVITTLIDRGMAYVIEGNGVYFDVSKLDGYGALPHRSADDLRDGSISRVEVDEDKDDPLDFALWKAAKPGEPTWQSPWGDGRPGWHIECVAMALDLLGDGFEIHGGGDDLVFPHHENERAEAVGAGHSFARHWVHNGMVNVDGEKMSKSLGNFTTLADLLDRFDPRALRLLVLQTHYRKTMEIDVDGLRQASAAIDRLDAMARRARMTGLTDVDERDGDAVAAFTAAMDDDLGTPAALAVVFDTLRAANAAHDAGDPTAASLVATVVELAGVLGLEIGNTVKGEDDEDVAALIAAREQARADKDFATSDRIRDDLAKRGIVIEDTATGTTWHRT